VIGTPCSATITAQLAVGKLQLSGADFTPLMMIGICLANPTCKAAVPVTTQLPASPGNVPEVVTVMLDAVALKTMLPGTFTGKPPLQVNEKL
jgi:hypothetical protein